VFKKTVPNSEMTRALPRSTTNSVGGKPNPLLSLDNTQKDFSIQYFTTQKEPKEICRMDWLAKKQAYGGFAQ
jgi:hypothetical protein